MAFIEAPTNFYLGRTFNASENKLGEDVVYYDSRDLTTHALVVGMTGSGKTGLCITLLEEAVLDNIPAIIIDPKGDITNLLLTFPNLQPQDFQPWIHADDARRAGMDIPTYSADVANRWRGGLQKWGIVPDRLAWLNRAAKYSVYTPGSDAGLPVSILASLKAPSMQEWQTGEEGIREKITGVTTALLALAGINAEPVKDEEHVLISNIFEYNWRQGRNLTLEDIVLQIKQPPFDKLGVFPIDQYMSEKKRYKLAMEMNNIIAAPSFQSWIRGEPMDIQRLLYQPNGRPRVSIFYTAHLNDAERMFITTLILESLIGWMRTLPGTTSLRALLYIDEMFGYFPPYPKNPPTKEPILRLLKQARAFGIGLIMATQNPGDLDYKGLSNMGTWFIGRLQSENDRKKVMAGLKELATADEGLNLSDVENLIADIKPRVFLMRNVHNAGGPLLLHTRWTMNYLAGPMTRQQIGFLMQGQRQQLMQQLAQQYYQGQQPQPLQQNNWAQPQQNFYGGAQAAPPMQPGFGQQGGQTGYPAPPPMPPGFGQQGGQTGYPAPPPMPPGFQQNPQQGGFGTPPMPPGFQQNPQQGGFPMPPPMPGQTGGFGAQSVPGQTGGFPPVNPGDTGQMRAQSAAPGFAQSKPPVSSAISEFFLPNTLTTQQAIQQHQQETGQAVPNAAGAVLAYKPVLLAQAAVRYSQKSAQIYTARDYAFHVPDVPQQGIIYWEEHQAPVIDRRQISNEPFGQAMFGELSIGLTDDKRMKALQKEVVDMLYNTARMTIPFHPQFKIYGDPDRDISEFQTQVYQLAREKRDEEIDKLSNKYAGMMDKLEDRLRRKERELEAEKLEIRDRRREQLYTTGEAVLSIFKGRTNYTLSRMSRTTRMKRQTEAEIEESRDVLDELEREMLDLEQEYEHKLQEVNDRWAAVANDFQDHIITPYKKDIHLDMFGIGWIPHWYINAGGQTFLIPAFR